MDKWSAVAIAGVWAGVGWSSMAGDVVCMVAICGFFATVAIVKKKD